MKTRSIVLLLLAITLPSRDCGADAHQAASTNSVRLLWATNDPPFGLQTTTNLPATDWISALPLPTVIGTTNTVTNAVVGTRRFYRLSNP